MPEKTISEPAPDVILRAPFKSAEYSPSTVKSTPSSILNVCAVFESPAEYEKVVFTVTVPGVPL